MESSEKKIGKLWHFSEQMFHLVHIQNNRPRKCDCLRNAFVYGGMSRWQRTQRTNVTQLRRRERKRRAKMRQLWHLELTCFSWRCGSDREQKSELACFWRCWRSPTPRRWNRRRNNCTAASGSEIVDFSNFLSLVMSSCERIPELAEVNGFFSEDEVRTKDDNFLLKENNFCLRKTDFAEGKQAFTEGKQLLLKENRFCRRKTCFYWRKTCFYWRKTTFA